MKLEAILLFILVINTGLFLFQTSIDKISIEENIDSTVIYNFEDSILSQYDAGNFTVINDATAILPNSESALSADDSGNVFTDAFVTLKSWFLENTGIGYLISFVTALPNFLKFMNLPVEITFALGAMWYSVVAFIIVMVVTGRY